MKPETLLCAQPQVCPNAEPLPHPLALLAKLSLSAPFWLSLCLLILQFLTCFLCVCSFALLKESCYISLAKEFVLWQELLQTIPCSAQGCSASLLPVVTLARE